jgi:hypothetical protein
MFDVLGTFKGEVDQIKAELLLAARIAVLKELAVCELSRLATLDPGNAPTYLAAIKTIS